MRVLFGLLLPLVAGCASVPLQRAGSLSSYDHMAPQDGWFTRAQVSVSRDDILAAKTIRIVPTTFVASALQIQLPDTQRRLVANAVDRSLCIGLSDRFQIVTGSQPADLVVQASITSIVPTNEAAVVASKALSVATSVATHAASVSVPVPSVRIPIGLGGLALEAEARDGGGTQKAAMMWARGANAFIGQPRASPAGDAYDLASAFGDDFSKLLVTGASPFKTMPSLPAMHRVGSMVGAAPKESACDAFGRGGVAGLAGAAIGLPPEWTDNGARTDTSSAR
ncbi:DUF3313 domain-containing protein [Phreatobacter stygius]|uniref:DUF3313 domain-containing protein n=1 Tax=Phreatobacter stygius TaxID=1940610 RepID=A0A4D7B8F0_9HYPH|nr:DUF3313 domain-containing protein [Phreatobacter stygius]QCI65856.1 DUF3313 domain-containing protein [Phreatobacter stygius]